MDDWPTDILLCCSSPSFSPPSVVIYKAFSPIYQLVFCSFILQRKIAVRNESWDWVLLAKDCILFTWRCWPPLADRPCIEIRWQVFADAQRVRGCRNERAGRLEVWVVLPQHFPGKLLTPTLYSREKECPEEHPHLRPPSSSQLHSLWKAPPKHWETKRKYVQKRKVLYSKSTVSFQFFFLLCFFYLFIFLSHRAFFGAKDWRIGGRNTAGAWGPRRLFPKRQPDKQRATFPPHSASTGLENLRCVQSQLIPEWFYRFSTHPWSNGNKTLETLSAWTQKTCRLLKCRLQHSNKRIAQLKSAHLSNANANFLLTWAREHYAKRCSHL